MGALNKPPEIGEGEEYELRAGVPEYSLLDPQEARIVAWRYIAFQLLGMPEDPAADLAMRRDVDREQVERMLVAGASAEQIVAIVL